MHTSSIRLDHIRLDVRDIERAAAFYTAVLGLSEVVRYTIEQRVIVQLGTGGHPPGIELWQEAGLVPSPHPTQHVAFSVDDVAATVDHARRLGHPVVEEPFRIGQETVAFLKDPDGHLIEVNDFRGRGTGEAGEAATSSG